MGTRRRRAATELGREGSSGLEHVFLPRAGGPRCPGLMAMHCSQLFSIAGAANRALSESEACCREGSARCRDEAVQRGRADPGALERVRRAVVCSLLGGGELRLRIVACLARAGLETRSSERWTCARASCLRVLPRSTLDSPGAVEPRATSATLAERVRTAVHAQPRRARASKRRSDPATLRPASGEVASPPPVRVDRDRRSSRSRHRLSLSSQMREVRSQCAVLLAKVAS